MYSYHEKKKESNPELGNCLSFIQQMLIEGLPFVGTQFMQKWNSGKKVNVTKKWKSIR